MLTETVQDVAKAIAATAVAVSASCTGGGWAAAGGTASTSARASATALASAFSSVAACRNCTAGVEWFASATEQAAVESTTTAVVEVDGDASETIVRKNIEEALIPVFVSITTRTRTGYGDGDCRAGVFADFVVGDNALACETIAAAWVEEVSLSGVADAAAATAAYACEEGPIAAGGSKLVAFATAQAFARAVAEANVVRSPSHTPPHPTVALLSASASSSGVCICFDAKADVNKRIPAVCRPGNQSASSRISEAYSPLCLLGRHMRQTQP